MYPAVKMTYLGGRQKLYVSLVLGCVFVLALWKAPVLIPLGIAAASVYDLVRAAAKQHNSMSRRWLTALAVVALLGVLGMFTVLALPDGAWLFFGLGFVTAATDTWAQVIGRKYGTPGTFMPLFSPSKSRTGVYGSWGRGVALAVSLLLVYWVCSVNVTPAYTLALLLAPFVSTYGDLLASATKRAVGIKDFGTYLGKSTGGALDRVDSWLAVFAVAWLVLCVFAQVTSFVS